MKLVLRRGSNILNRFISKEFLINFLVAFTFFFLIFFVNSILLLVQRILLKNIDFKTMLALVQTMSFWLSRAVEYLKEKSFFQS